MTDVEFNVEEMKNEIKNAISTLVTTVKPLYDNYLKQIGDDMSSDFDANKDKIKSFFKFYVFLEYLSENKEDDMDNTYILGKKQTFIDLYRQNMKNKTLKAIVDEKLEPILKEVIDDNEFYKVNKIINDNIKTNFNMV